MSTVDSSTKVPVPILSSQKHLNAKAFACKRAINLQMLDSSMQAVSRHQEMKEIDGRLKIQSPLDNGVTC